MLIYILVYSEWDGGSGEIIENVIASSDRNKLEARQSEMEVKSKEAREKIKELDKKKYADLLPHSKELNDVIMKLAPQKATKLDANKRQKLVDKRRELTEAMGKIQLWFTEEKDKVLNNLGLDYYIDDPDTSSFHIEELEVLE